MYTKDLKKEEQLLHDVHKDKSHFDNLYRYFLQDVYRYSYSVVNNQHDAEDITSQVFITLYNKIDNFTWQGVSMKNWLFTTARNLCYKKFREPVTTELNEEVNILDETEVGFVEEIMNKDLLEKVQEEIQKLSPLEQETINLRVWEGMTYSEIATLQNGTEEAARKRFSRSIKKLQSALKDRGVKSLVPLPVLLTSIKQIASTPAYAAPQNLTEAGIHQLLTNHNTMNTTLTTMKTFLTSNLGIGLIAGTVVLTGAGVGTWAYTASQSDDKDQTNTEQTNTTTNTETKDENSLLYKNEEFGFQFAYHDQFAVVEDTPADAQEYIVLQLGHSMDARYNGMLTFISKDEALISKNTFDTKGKNLSDLEIAAILATSNQCFEVTSFSQENFGANEWIHGSTQGPCDVMEEGKTFEYHVYAKEMSNGYYAIWNRTDYVDGDSPESVTLTLETFKEIERVSPTEVVPTNNNVVTSPTQTPTPEDPRQPDTRTLGLLNGYSKEGKVTVKGLQSYSVTDHVKTQCEGAGCITYSFIKINLGKGYMYVGTLNTAGMNQAMYYQDARVSNLVVKDRAGQKNKTGNELADVFERVRMTEHKNIYSYASPHSEMICGEEKPCYVYSEIDHQSASELSFFKNTTLLNWYVENYYDAGNTTPFVNAWVEIDSEATHSDINEVLNKSDEIAKNITM
ncbi:MAG: RNA polymerase sigma factor [Candidatus Dojkabacteria bacterium]